MQRTRPGLWRVTHAASTALPALDAAFEAPVPSAAAKGQLPRASYVAASGADAAIEDDTYNPAIFPLPLRAHPYHMLSSLQ